MLVVCPVCTKDLPLAIKVVRHAASLEKSLPLPNECWLVRERGLDVAELHQELSKLFRIVLPMEVEPWTGSPDWPQPQNHMWQETARAIEASKLTASWLWWEPDAIPLEAGWLATLDRAYQAGKRPLAAAVAHQPSTGHYPAGVAIYPPDPSNHFPNAMITMARAFDIAMAQRDGALSKTHDISGLICHRTEANTRFDSAADLAQIPDSAVLFHKCKDGSLVDVLQGRAPAPPGLGQQTQPMLVEQAAAQGWQAGVFAFPTEPWTVWFNPSLLRWQDKLWLFARKYQAPPGKPNGSTISAFQVHEATMTLHPREIQVQVPAREDREQFEDPKAFLDPTGQPCLMCSNWVHFWDKHKIRQSLLRLSPDLSKATLAAEPVFGGQAPNRQDGTRHEKNWTPFVLDAKLNYVYSINPHQVFQTCSLRPSLVLETWTSPDQDLGWTAGEPRGGTPPIRVGDEFISFFHSSVTWQKPKRRYAMGAYAFEAKPPFRITRVTRQPLLVGSEHDVRTQGGPLVVFPNGAVLASKTWTIVAGINDEACLWVKISQAKLDKRLERL